MLLRVTVFIVAVLAVHQSALGQSVRDKCLTATNTGDATINCQKAGMLLQEKQLKVLSNIWNLLANKTNRSLAQTAKNTALANRQLQDIANSLNSQGAAALNYLFVSDLRDVGGSVVECDAGAECGEIANVAADQICRNFGYEGQRANEFENLDDPKDTVRIKWVVCRP